MAVTTDIVQSWRHPRSVIRSHLRRGQSEPFAFSLLVAFLILAFVAQIPSAARVTALDATIPVSAQLLARGLGLLATIPVLYGLAALSHLAMRALGGQGTGYGARLALFWALVAASPMVLLSGMVAGMIGPGPQLAGVGALTFAAFLFQWFVALREVARPLQELS